MRKVSFFLILFFIVSCSTQPLKSRTVENYFQSSGIEKYFLSEIPTWANLSETSGCFRNHSVRFFDIENMMKSYNYSFVESIQIQATFNNELEALKDKNKDKTIPMNDEQLLFFKASEKVSSKLNFFDAPTFNRINLVWIDSILKDKSEEKKLRTFLNSSVFDQGVPMLVSLCMTKSEVEKLFPDFNYKILSAEMLSVFEVDGSKSPYFKLQIDKFFNEKQSLYFYSREKIFKNNNFIGKMNFINY
jgi:hypothetical protein